MAAFLNFDPHKLGGARNNEVILAISRVVVLRSYRVK